MEPNFAKIDQINLVLKEIALRKESAFFHILAVTILVQVQVQKLAAPVKYMNDSSVDLSDSLGARHQGWLVLLLDFRFALSLGTNTQIWSTEYFLMHSISLSDNKSVHIKCEYGVKNVYWLY